MVEGRCLVKDDLGSRLTKRRLVRSRPDLTCVMGSRPAGIAATLKDMAEVIGRGCVKPLAVRPGPAGAAAAPIVLPGIARAPEDLPVFDVGIEQIRGSSAHHADNILSIRLPWIAVTYRSIGVFARQIARSHIGLVVVLRIHPQR